MATHQFKYYDIPVTDDTIEALARKYVDFRSEAPKLPEDLEENPIFKNLGFDTNKIKDLIRNNTIPIRNTDGAVMRDIYRSDLGELLMTLYFDYQETDICDGESFIIPIKNIWDREHNDMPGRGVDLIGYKLDGDSRQLLIGEAKVSHEKQNPPAVVNTSNDSIYNNHKKNATDRTYLTRRLANFIKKVDGEAAKNFSLILLGLTMPNVPGLYEIVYGCCLIRDKDCFKDNDDYGKLQTNMKEFEPGKVYFIIPVFDKPIEDTVNLFHEKVESLKAEI